MEREVVVRNIHLQIQTAKTHFGNAKSCAIFSSLNLGGEWCGNCAGSLCVSSGKMEEGNRIEFHWDSACCEGGMLGNPADDAVYADKCEMSTL